MTLRISVIFFCLLLDFFQKFGYLLLNTVFSPMPGWRNGRRSRLKICFPLGVRVRSPFRVPFDFACNGLIFQAFFVWTRPRGGGDFPFIYSNGPGYRRSFIRHTAFLPGAVRSVLYRAVDLLADPRNARRQTGRDPLRSAR